MSSSLFEKPLLWKLWRKLLFASSEDGNPFVIIFCAIVANAVGQDRNLDYVGFITPIIWQLINPSFRSSVRQDDHIYHSKPPHQRDDNSSRDLLFLHVCYPRKLYDHNHAFMIDARLAIALKDRSFQCWLVWKYRLDWLNGCYNDNNCIMLKI